jgi:hypothetical protein
MSGWRHVVQWSDSSPCTVVGQPLAPLLSSLGVGDATTGSGVGALKGTDTEYFPFRYHRSASQLLYLPLHEASAVGCALKTIGQTTPQTPRPRQAWVWVGFSISLPAHG